MVQVGRGQLTPRPRGADDHQIWWSKVKGLLDVVFGNFVDGFGDAWAGDYPALLDLK
jgi:hypothetical protein